MIPAFLIGGGWEPEGWSQTYGPFVQAAQVSGRCRISLILAADHNDEKMEIATKYRSVFETLGVPAEEMTIVWISETSPLKPEVLAASQPTGVFVGGGLTPAYQTALCSDKTWLDYLHQKQIPYAGFSAGAAIAVERAIVGGWKVRRAEQEIGILDADFGEGIEYLEVRPGLGLLPFAVDVHASQWGTITRLMQAVDLGMVADGWAIDENTLVHAYGDQLIVGGLGHAYHVQRREAGELSIRMYRAGQSVEFRASS